MKKFGLFAVIMGMALVSLSVLAQEVVDMIPTQDFISALLQSVGGMKGASTMAIAYAVSQLGIMFLKTPLFGEIFKSVTGGIKLLIASGLTVIVSIAGLMMNGVPLSAAVVHSAVLAAVSVFLNEVYKYAIAKKQ